MEKNMTLQDIRSLSPDARMQLRREAVKLYRRDGNKSSVARELRLRRATVSDWLLDYEQTGNIVREEKKRGKPLGVGRRLTEVQEQYVRKCVTDCLPEHLNIPCHLWTASAIKHLISTDCSTDLPMRTVRLYMKRWGFASRHTPIQTHGQQPEFLQCWLDKHYHSIKNRAVKERAEIHWLDDAVLTSSGGNAVGMVYSILNQGKVRFMIYRQKLHAQILLEFLRRLLNDTDRKVFLIAETTKVDHSGLIKSWLDQKRENIECFLYNCVN